MDARRTPSTDCTGIPSLTILGANEHWVNHHLLPQFMVLIPKANNYTETPGVASTKPSAVTPTITVLPSKILKSSSATRTVSNSLFQRNQICPFGIRSNNGITGALIASMPRGLALTAMEERQWQQYNFHCHGRIRIVPNTHKGHSTYHAVDFWEKCLIPTPWAFSPSKTDPSIPGHSNKAMGSPIFATPGVRLGWDVVLFGAITTVIYKLARLMPNLHQVYLGWG